MKREILIFTVLISNIAFASVVPIEIREYRETNTNKNKVNALYSDAVAHLHSRGLDENIAEQKISKYLKYDEFTNALMVQNIIENFNELSRKDIISYVADSALYGKCVDFSSYDNMIDFIQKSNKIVLENTIFKKIEKISFENRKIKSLYSV